MGKVALAIYRHHKGCPTTYQLCDEAQDYFDGILDNLASQFNSHYDIEESITESQTQLNAEHRSDIDVHTKVGELIGCLSAVLWICCDPSSDLPGLKTSLPYLPTKQWSEDGAPVLRPGCPIFQLQVLPHLPTRLEDGADPTSDLPQLPTMSG